MDQQRSPQPLPTNTLVAPATTTSTNPYAARLPHPPALPATLLRAHAAFIPGDSRFAASARLLASLWRADRGLPAGTHVTRTPDGRTRRTRAGYRLRPDAARAGAAFLDPATATYFRRALILQEPGALWDAPKITGHLLSSQGLALNLLAPLALHPDLATSVFRQLLPDLVHAVTGVVLETSPGRDDPAYLGEGTAWDARIDIVTPDGEPGFIAVEFKLIEMLGTIQASARPRYAEAARASGLYLDPLAPTLYRAGLEQLRREHTLAHLALSRGLAGRAHLVLVGPALNPRVGATAAAYAAHLVDPAGARGSVGFGHLTLEAILGALAQAGAGDLARALHARYLDLDRVAALALADAGGAPTPPPTSPAAPPRPASAPPLLLPPPSSSPSTSPDAGAAPSPSSSGATTVPARRALPDRRPRPTTSPRRPEADGGRPARSTPRGVDRAAPSSSPTRAPSPAAARLRTRRATTASSERRP